MMLSYVSDSYNLL